MLAGLLGAVTPGFAIDIEEGPPLPPVWDDHGNSAPMATPIACGSSTGGRIDYAGDHDWFRVTLSADSTLKVYSTGTTDVYGYVKNGAEATLATDDDGAGYPNFLMELPYLPTGTYYVQVRHWSGGGTGPYNLVTECTPVVRKRLSVDVRGSGTVTSSPPGISCAPQCVAYYPPMTRVDLTATPASGHEFVVWGGSCGGTSPTCRLSMSDDRTVSASFAPIAPIPDDHGDTCGTATPFPLNSYLGGNLERVGDHDSFRVTLPRPGWLYAVTGGDTDTWGDLYDGGETLLASDDDSGPGYNFLIGRSMPAGTYCLQVRHWSTGTGPYSLQVYLYQ